VRAHTLPAWLQCGGEVTPWLLTVSASAGERAPRGGRPPHPALCRSGPGRAAHIPGGAALGQARGAAGRAQRCAAGLPADEALLYDRRAPVAQLVCRSWKRELGPRPPVMWKVPQAVLVREVTLEGGVTQLWPNKDKVVPRIGGSRYVLFTMDNRAQVRRGPSGRSRVAWDVACGRAGCFAASTFIAWSTHLFCGWTRWGPSLPGGRAHRRLRPCSVPALRL